MKTQYTNAYPIKITKKEYSTFSQRLKVTMELRECSIEELAEHTYVTKSTIYGYLNGTRSPSLDVLSLLAQHLDVSTDFLIGLKEYIYI